MIDQAQARLARLDRAHNEPPCPVRGVYVPALNTYTHPETRITARFAWRQTTALDIELPYGAPESEITKHIAGEAAATPNPLRELAAALLDFADQMDHHGIVPLGINVRTSHGMTNMNDDRAAAVVETSVLGVRRDWVEQNTEAAA